MKDLIADCCIQFCLGCFSAIFILLMSAIPDIGAQTLCWFGIAISVSESIRLLCYEEPKKGEGDGK